MAALTKGRRVGIWLGLLLSFYPIAHALTLYSLSPAVAVWAKTAFVNVASLKAHPDLALAVLVGQPAWWGALAGGIGITLALGTLIEYLQSSKNKAGAPK